MNTIIENRILDIKRYIANHNEDIKETENRLRVLKERVEKLEEELRECYKKTI